MLKSTHVNFWILIFLFIWLLFYIKFQYVFVYWTLLIVILSLFSDIDHENWILNRKFKVTWIIAKMFSHRWFTH